MLKIAVCDDEICFTARMESIIERISGCQGIQTEIDVFFDGMTLLENMKNNNAKYDIVFLDIEMENINGLVTARKIREFDEIVYLVYVTSHTNYAVEAYEVHPFSFLLKPVEEDQLKKIFLLMYERIRQGAFYYEYKFRKDYYRVLVHDIMYFESNKRLIHIHMSDGSVYTYYDKMNLIERRLIARGADFWRIHRSILVNGRYIRCKAYDHVILSDHSVFMISEDRRKSLHARYAGTIEEEIN